MEGSRGARRLGRSEGRGLPRGGDDRRSGIRPTGGISPAPWETGMVSPGPLCPQLAGEKNSGDRPERLRQEGGPPRSQPEARIAEAGLSPAIGPREREPGAEGRKPQAASLQSGAEPAWPTPLIWGMSLSPVVRASPCRTAEAPPHHTCPAPQSPTTLSGWNLLLQGQPEKRSRARKQGPKQEPSQIPAGEAPVPGMPRSRPPAHAL